MVLVAERSLMVTLQFGFLVDSPVDRFHKYATQLIGASMLAA